MTNFQQKLHEILALYKDGINILTISDDIEREVDNYCKSLEDKAYKDGFDEGKKSVDKFSRFFEVFPIVLGVVLALFAFAWIMSSFSGCEADMQKERNAKIAKREQYVPEINATLKACSDGDFTGCRQGWLKFNTDEFIKDEGPYSRSNNTCQSFEEAYYNKTKSMLILDKDRAYFKKDKNND